MDVYMSKNMVLYINENFILGTIALFWTLLWFLVLPSEHDVDKRRCSYTSVNSIKSLKVKLLNVQFTSIIESAISIKIYCQCISPYVHSSITPGSKFSLVNQYGH